MGDSNGFFFGSGGTDVDLGSWLNEGTKKLTEKKFPRSVIKTETCKNKFVPQPSISLTKRNSLFYELNKNMFQCFNFCPSVRNSPPTTKHSFQTHKFKATFDSLKKISVKYLVAYK